MKRIAHCAWRMAHPRVLHRVSAHLVTRSITCASIDYRNRTSRIGESRIANRASAFSVELQHCSSFIAHRASTLRIVRQPCASRVSLAHRASTSRIARQPRASRGNLAHRAAISRIARQPRATRVSIALQRPALYRLALRRPASAPLFSVVHRRRPSEPLSTQQRLEQRESRTACCSPQSVWCMAHRASRILRGMSAYLVTRSRASAHCTPASCTA
jgi:hypothetical protein